MEKVMHETARRLFEAIKLVRKDIDGPADLARALNQSEQTINNWSYRGNGVSRDGRLLAQKELGISATWIADGIGPMLVATKHISSNADGPKKSQIAGKINQPTPAGSASIGKDSSQKFDQNVAMAPTGQRKIPVISYVQAGKMTEVLDPFALGEGLETILTDIDVSEGAFGLVISGESMLPEFRPGDKVIIDPALSPQPGDMVVAKNGEEEATFKKYRPRGTGEAGDMVFELVPLNDDFPVLQSERDHLRIIGVMVEHRKYRKR